MKAFERHLEGGERNHQSNRVAKLGGNILMAVFMMCCLQSNAQSKDQVISITGTQFTYPLIKRWIIEYSKINPDLKFRLVNDQENYDKVDLKIIAHTPEKGRNNRQQNAHKSGVVMPFCPLQTSITNCFRMSLKKGVKHDRLKAIFMKEEDNLEVEKVKEPEYTVYTKTPQSCVARVISSYLGRPVPTI